MDENSLRSVLATLLDYFHVIPIETEMLKKGLHSKHKDFEDALQMQCAYSIDKMDCIVTRNIKDFHNCEIPVISPDELVKKIIP